MMKRDLTRRTLLALAGAGVIESRLQAAQAQLRKLRNGKAITLQFFTPAHYELMEILTEMIIPTDVHSPGARQARVASYIDLVVGNSSDDTKTTWRKGLNAFEVAVQDYVGASFTGAGPQMRGAAVTHILEQGNDGDALGRAFFMRVREMTIFGYYSSEIGLLKELEYQGNQVMAMFPGCEH